MIISKLCLSEDTMLDVMSVSKVKIKMVVGAISLVDMTYVP